MKKTRIPHWRMMIIDQRIRQGRYPNASTLAAELQVSRKTVWRDIEFMRNFFKAPIEFDRKRNGYFYTEESYFLPAVSLTEGELITFFIAEKVLKQYAGTPYETVLKKAFTKIAAFLPDEVSIDLAQLDSAYSFDLGAISRVDLEIFQTLSRAVVEGEQLEMIYYSQHRNVETQRVIDPYHLANIRGDWYLIAYCHTRKEIRMFALNRIRSLEPTGEIFSQPEEFSLEEYLADSLLVERGEGAEEVVLKFTPYQARWIREKRWHSTQELEEAADGSLILKMKVALSDELKRWIMGFGKEVEVLAPQTLRERVAQEVGQMGKIYEKI